MKDTVEIKEQSGKGRMVCLQTTLAVPSMSLSSNQNKASREVKCFVLFFVCQT